MPSKGLLSVHAEYTCILTNILKKMLMQEQSEILSLLH